MLYQDPAGSRSCKKYVANHQESQLVISLPVGEGKHEGGCDGGGPGGGGRPALQVGAHGEAEESDGLLEGVERVVPQRVAGQHRRLVRDQVRAVHRLLVAYEDVRTGHALQQY